MQNRFEQFSQNIIAMYTGSAGAFDPARMMFPPEEKEASSQEMQNLYMTNVYRIQNLTEENYLYRQNFQFLTQMFEKQIHKQLYPQVERQVEKTIRQELPKAEDRVIREMTKELHTLVKESGVEQLRVLEKEAKEEQKVLLRKIENIYNSSVYVNVQAKNIQNDNISINGRVENGQKTGVLKTGTHGFVHRSHQCWSRKINRQLKISQRRFCRKSRQRMPLLQSSRRNVSTWSRCWKDIQKERQTASRLSGKQRKL